MVVNPHQAVVNRIAEHQLCHLDLALCQAAFMAWYLHRYDRRSHGVRGSNHTIDIKNRCIIDPGQQGAFATTAHGAGWTQLRAHHRHALAG
ncbi:hypothetical protein G6F50_017318 [Rhizopus delemar]|uniref:Uncharacterized protein n=1 Tax=Rhizopus delemar TaxID=936053 RepID=A0A9P7BZX3_9FUNG|nr:hypothetical protein G6F50_017318 [Rhizopus delemar]